MNAEHAETRPASAIVDETILQLTERHLLTARDDDRGRSAELILHDNVLRQTIIALTEGAQLEEHNSPHAASLQVLAGTVQLTSDGDADTLTEGQICRLTRRRHGVVAVTDTAFLLTTVTSVPQDVAGS